MAHLRQTCGDNTRPATCNARTRRRRLPLPSPCWQPWCHMRHPQRPLGQFHAPARRARRGRAAFGSRSGSANSGWATPGRAPDFEVVLEAAGVGDIEVLEREAALLDEEVRPPLSVVLLLGRAREAGIDRNWAGALAISQPKLRRCSPQVPAAFGRVGVKVRPSLGRPSRPHIHMAKVWDGEAEQRLETGDMLAAADATAPTPPPSIKSRNSLRVDVVINDISGPPPQGTQQAPNGMVAAALVQSGFWEVKSALQIQIPTGIGANGVVRREMSESAMYGHGRRMGRLVLRGGQGCRDNTCLSRRHPWAPTYLKTPKLPHDPQDKCARLLSLLLQLSPLEVGQDAPMAKDGVLEIRPKVGAQDSESDRLAAHGSSFGTRATMLVCPASKAQLSKNFA